MNVIDRLLYQKQDPIFDMAKDLICQVREKLDNPEKEIKLKFPKKNRIQIIPGDKHSPWMTCYGEESDIILIEFPTNSTPYEDQITTKVKECIILEGNIYDANNPDFMRGTGDKFEVYPWQNIAPYTKDTTCLAMVTLR
jgi:hypothetical protein